MAKSGLFQRLMFSFIFFTTLSSFANETTISDYNRNLPFWGTSWAAGAHSINGYYPSFYTGFAARSQFPNRIHVRLARGNQTRVSVILDEQTIGDYLFDLVKRYEFYKKISAPLAPGKVAPANVNPANSKLSPQLESYFKIIESNAYGILAFVKRARTGGETDESIYTKALSVFTQLNPGRVFSLRVDLKREFLNWKTQMKQNFQFPGAATAKFAVDPKQVVMAINSLVWGRINYTAKPSTEVLAKLSTAAELAVNGDEAQFLASALDLFKVLTGSKYQIRSYQNGQWVNAIQCANSNSCYLVYNEFTAIYPTGSVKAETRDQSGNAIPLFATPGLWNFLAYGGSREVDNVRDEPYYGWIPKMDYEGIGNGYHNPAVRFRNLTVGVKQALNISNDHDTFWSVKRGGVSHGCSRLSTGHIWELRHIFPVENSKMIQVFYFGSMSQDFDVYDIDGNGTLEVMGVEYMISYDLQGASGLGKREGSNLEINAERKLEFYQRLYGSRDVFTVENNGQYFFSNPGVSLPSYLNLSSKNVTTRVTIPGRIPLREQAYERDKVQFYRPASTPGTPEFKLLIRLLGRVRGCKPTADKNNCGEAAFDQEAQEVLKLYVK
ncbi:MAG: hypothetical protein AB7F59_10810 [Bdellovibrionales bacterium]